MARKSKNRYYITYMALKNNEYVYGRHSITLEEKLSFNVIEKIEDNIQCLNEEYMEKSVIILNIIKLED